MLLQLRSKAPSERAEALIGKPAEQSHYPVLVHGEVDVYKPDGKPLLFVRRQVLTEAAVAGALPFLSWLRHHQNNNRGAYAGGSYKAVLASGLISNTHHATPVRSAAVGFLDRSPRIPYCRDTYFTRNKAEEWGACLPQIREVASVMRALVPSRFALQQEAAESTHPAYVIPGTPFTTLTVNNTVSGSYHRDAGDFAPGFGAMSVHRRGDYTGCHLVFPAYGVGVDLGDRDVILFDPHEIHGNTPFGPGGEPMKDYDRISVVYYFRNRMTDCLAPPDELKRAQGLRKMSPEEEADADVASTERAD